MGFKEWWKAVFANLLGQWLATSGGALSGTLTAYLFEAPPWTYALFIIAGVTIGLLILSMRKTGGSPARASGELKEAKKPESKPKVPVIVEFNPELAKYFRNETRGNYDPAVGMDVYREYVCTVVNVSAESLTNVSWEVDRVVWGQDRPDDPEYVPESLHEKLRYDLPSLSTKMDFNSHEREKLCLFSRLRKVGTDNEPIRIVNSSTAFHDRKRLMTIFIKVTANNYAEKHFSTEMWVHDGFLRMTGIRPETD